MINVTIISPRKSMDVINNALEHQDFGCTFTNYVYKQLEDKKVEILESGGREKAEE